MSVDLDAIRGRLNKLENTQKKSDSLWKPTPGKTEVRIVPYKFNPDFPFIELYFHYGINNKTFVSPISFGRPDPIAEFSDKLKSLGSTEEWKEGKKFEPKLRTFAPVLVRGKENEGVKFWGFGKTVYQDILGYMADEDYGDITDPSKGRDITIEYKTAQESGTQFPTTTIRVKPKESPIVNDPTQARALFDNQTDIKDLYPELSYDELKEQLTKHISGGTEEDSTEAPAVSQTISTPAPVVETPTQSAPVSTTKSDDVSKAFDDIFAKK